MTTIIKVVPLGHVPNSYTATSFGVADIHPSFFDEEVHPSFDVVLPINGRMRKDQVKLVSGLYRVRVRLPTGETLTEEVTIPGKSQQSTLVLETDVLASERARRPEPPEDRFAQLPGDDRRSKRDSSHGQKSEWNWSKFVLPSPLIGWLNDSQGLANVLRSPGVGDRSAKYVLNRVRVQAPDAKLDFLRNPASIDRAARSLFGAAVSVQPTKVYESKGAPSSSKWKVAEKNLINTDVQVTKRYYGVLTANDYRGLAVEKVASIPDRWIGMDGSLDDVFRAEIVPHPDFPNARRIELSVSDPQAMSLMDFLQSGDLDAALAVAKPAMGFDRTDEKNAYATIAAAYALVFAPASAGPQGWENWVLELAEQRKDIPDGKILEATLLLQRKVDKVFVNGKAFPPSEPGQVLSDAWACVEEALRRGPPVFRLGLQLLEENLRILSDARVKSIDGAKMKGAVSVASWLSARVDPYQPLCVFDIQ